MTDTSSEAAIRAIIEARANAVRAGDVDAMLADVADDIVIFDVVDPLRREGEPSSRERAVQWLASYKAPHLWENCDVDVATDGDVAFSYSLRPRVGALRPRKRQGVARPRAGVWR